MTIYILPAYNMINSEKNDAKIVLHSPFTVSIFGFPKYVLSLRAGDGRLVQ